MAKLGLLCVPQGWGLGGCRIRLPIYATLYLSERLGGFGLDGHEDGEGAGVFDFDGAAGVEVAEDAFGRVGQVAGLAEVGGVDGLAGAEPDDGDALDLVLAVDAGAHEVGRLGDG